MLTRAIGLCCLLLLCSPQSALRADDVDDQLEDIARTGPGGLGSGRARMASAELSGYDTELLPRIVEAMDTPNIVAANWLRGVYERMLERDLARDKPRLPLEFLKTYVADPKRQGRARRLVLEVVERQQPAFRNELLPNMLDDPEFRADAVALVLDDAQRKRSAGEMDAARQAFRQAFEHARASEQVVAAADALQTLGEPVDPVAHLGLVVDWWLVGPFDAPGKTGFGAQFPPEKSVDLQAAYPGQGGQKIRWQKVHVPDRLGQLDLLKPLGAVREAVAYAFCELNSPAEQTGELRAGADDNCTVWLNGEKILAREQWLNGIRMDRFVVPAKLTAGPNRLLVKICQGPQHKDPEVPNNWSLQLRLCDPQGKGLEFKNSASSPRGVQP